MTPALAVWAGELPPDWTQICHGNPKWLMKQWIFCSFILNVINWGGWRAVSHVILVGRRGSGLVVFLSFFFFFTILCPSTNFFFSYPSFYSVTKSVTHVFWCFYIYISSSIFLHRELCVIWQQHWSLLFFPLVISGVQTSARSEAVFCVFLPEINDPLFYKWLWICHSSFELYRSGMGLSKRILGSELRLSPLS